MPKLPKAREVEKVLKNFFGQGNHLSTHSDFFANFTALSRIYIYFFTNALIFKISEKKIDFSTYKAGYNPNL